MDEDFDITKHVSEWRTLMEDNRIEVGTRGLFDKFNHLDLLAYCEQSQVEWYASLLYDIADYIVQAKETIEPGDTGSFGYEPKKMVRFTLVDDPYRDDRIRLLVEESIEEEHENGK